MGKQDHLWIFHQEIEIKIHWIFPINARKPQRAAALAGGRFIAYRLNARKEFIIDGMMQRAKGSVLRQQQQRLQGINMLGENWWTLRRFNFCLSAQLSEWMNEWLINFFLNSSSNINIINNNRRLMIELRSSRSKLSTERWSTLFGAVPVEMRSPFGWPVLVSFIWRSETHVFTCH